MADDSKILTVSTGTAVALDVMQDWGQFAVDAITKGEVINEAPLIRTVAGAIKMVSNIRDQLLIKKLARFLSVVSEVSESERARMITRLESDPAYGRRVGEHVIESLDRMESHRKPTMLGLVFAAYARGRIDRKTLCRLMEAIERIPTTEIGTVRKFFDTENDPPSRAEIDAESIQALVTSGLADPLSGFNRLVYRPNETCRTFVTLDLDVKSPL